MPKTRKTERLFNFGQLDGSTKESAVASFAAALSNLEREAVLQGREPLWDTLEVDIERDVVEARSLVSVSSTVLSSNVVIRVSAEAVKR